MNRSHPITPRARRWILVAIIAMASAITARVLSIAWLDDVPHVMDEITYDLQARTFASGHLTAPAAAPLGAFNQWFVEDTNARYGIFPPGWPVLLALGHLLGIAWWINPLLHAATVVLVAALAERLWGGRAQLAAAAMYAFCPQALLQAASWMSHTTAAFLASVVLCAALGRALGPQRRWRDAIGGFALGWLAITRPLCAAVLATTAFVMLTVAAKRHRPGVREALVVAASWIAPFAICIAALGIYNHVLTGSAFRFPQTVYFDRHVPPILPGPHDFRYGPGCNDLGFGPTHGCEYVDGHLGHTPRQALKNSAWNLWVWLRLVSGAGLLFVAIALVLLRGRRRREAALLLLPFPLAIGAYALYWYVGTCYGARFYHTALPGFVAAAAGVLSIRAMRRRVIYVFAGGGLLAWNVYAMSRSGHEIAHHYWGTDDRFARFAGEWTGPDAVVLVAFQTPGVISSGKNLSWTAVGQTHVWTNSVRLESALAVNTPRLDGRLVFAKFHPAFVPELERRYPGRLMLLYIMGDRPRQDVVHPLQGSAFEGTGEAMPPQNFDGLVLRSARAR